MYKIVSTGLVLAFEAKLYFDKNQNLKFKTGCCCYFFFHYNPVAISDVWLNSEVCQILF